MGVACSQVLHFGSLMAVARDFVSTAIIINLVLAIFNMIPIPPLDGSRLVMGLLPNSYAYLYSRLEPYGILIVFLLLYMGLLEKFVWPAVVYCARFLGVS